MYKNRTNNCCEGYNTRLKGYFNWKSNIYKLLIKLKEEEDLFIKILFNLNIILYIDIKKMIIILYLWI